MAQDRSERLEAALDGLESETRRVVLAVEVGSRSHGWAHPGSDHDVVAVVQSAIRDYASLTPPKESFAVVDEGGVTVTAWDLRRMMQMIVSGTVIPLEVMRYSAQSRDRFGLAAAIREAEPDLISVKGALGSWRNEAGKSAAALARAQTTNTRTARHYLVAMRPLLMAMAFARSDFSTIPNGRIDELLNASGADEEIRSAVEDLVWKRKAGDLGALPGHIGALDGFIHRQEAALADMFEKAKVSSDGSKALRLKRSQQIFEDMLRLGDAAPDLELDLESGLRSPSR